MRLALSAMACLGVCAKSGSDLVAVLFRPCLALRMDGSDRGADDTDWAVLSSPISGTSRNRAKARANLSRSNRVGASISRLIVGSDVTKDKIRQAGLALRRARSVVFPFWTQTNRSSGSRTSFFLPHVKTRMRGADNDESCCCCPLLILVLLLLLLLLVTDDKEVDFRKLRRAILETDDRAEAAAGGGLL